MTLLVSARSALTLLFLCGGAFVLAAGCGSSDEKKNAPGEAGAGGDESGDPSSGGGKSDAGAPSDGGTPSDGGAPSDGGRPSEGGSPSAGQPSTGGAPEGGASGGQSAGGEAGAGGAPLANACQPAGSVTWINFDNEPIYQGCRDGVVRVPFTAEGGADQLTCCGTSTSAPAFEVELTGGYGDSSTAHLKFQVPSDAPLGVYALGVTCITESTEPGFSIEINDGDAPFVLSVSAEISPSGTMVIAGQHLADVSTVGAYRDSDGAYYQCSFDPQEDQTDTRIDCSFGGNIPLSLDESDTYTIHVASEDCGSSRNPPMFLVVPQST